VPVLQPGDLRPRLPDPLRDLLNGNTVDHSYFADGLLQSQTENTSGGTLVASHAYTCNPDSNKTQDVEKA
jgi:hypothetical protein